MKDTESYNLYHIDQKQEGRTSELLSSRREKLPVPRNWLGVYIRGVVTSLSPLSDHMKGCVQTKAPCADYGPL